MIAQWDSSLSVLPVAQVNSQPGQSISRDFSLADRTLPTHAEPAWLKMAQSPLKDTRQRQRGGRPKFNHGQMIEKNSARQGLHIACLLLRCLF